MVGIEKDKMRQKRYYNVKAEISNHCSLCSIDIETLEIFWIDCNKSAIGESKVKQFLLRSKMIFNEYYIGDYRLIGETDLSS